VPEKANKQIMTRTKQKSAGVFFLLLALALMATVPQILRAQAPQRFLGTITAIAGDTLTVKTDSGEAHQVQVPSSAVLKRIAPGQKDLSTAETIQSSDLATGDRVLVKLDPNATGSTPQAAQVIAMKQSDIAQQQEKEREAWQRNGVGGLVKSVDPAASVVVLTSGAGPTAKTITVHISKSTVLKRYAPNSIRFADAQPAALDAVHVGDQFRALGQKNADGTEMDVCGFGQFPEYFRSGLRDRHSRIHFDGKGPGHEEECNGSHYARCADASPARHDGAHDCRTSQGDHAGRGRSHYGRSLAGRNRWRTTRMERTSRRRRTRTSRRWRYGAGA
jgi:hypothetical protein